MTAVVAGLVTAATHLGVTPGELKGSADVRDLVRSEAGLGDLPVRAEQWRSVRSRVEAAHEDLARRHHGSQCKACSAWVVWGQTETGKAMSIDPLPRPGGNIVRMPQGRRMVLRVLPPAALPVVGRPAYQTHFVSCPRADELRRRRPARARRAGADGQVARCRACGTPMDPWLPGQGYATHPCCGPDEKRRTKTKEEKR